MQRFLMPNWERSYLYRVAQFTSGSRSCRNCPLLKVQNCTWTSNNLVTMSSLLLASTWRKARCTTASRGNCTRCRRSSGSVTRPAITACLPRSSARTSINSVLSCMMNCRRSKELNARKPLLAWMRTSTAMYRSLRSKGDPPARSNPYIENIPQRVPQQVEGQHKQHDRQPGRERQHRSMRNNKIVVFLDHQTPAGLRRLHPHPQKAQSRFDNDRGRKIRRGYHPYRPHHIGQNMPEEDARVGIAQRPRGFHEFAFSYCKHLSPDDPRHIDPEGQPDRDEDLPEALAQQQHDGEDQQQRRD